MKVLPEAFLSFFSPTHTTNVYREEKKAMEIRVNQKAPLDLILAHTFFLTDFCASYWFYVSAANIWAQVAPLTLLLKPTFHRLMFSPAFISSYYFFQPSEKSIISMGIYFS